MWHIGIDLHRHTVVIAEVNDTGQAFESVTHACRETEAILETVHRLKPFRVVTEATATYRRLYEILSEHGTVLLSHPAKLRLMTQRRAKTDKLDCQLLANLLRINQTPVAYIPPRSFLQLREITRYRASLVRGQAQAKVGLRALLASRNREARRYGIETHEPPAI